MFQAFLKIMIVGLIAPGLTRQVLAADAPPADDPRESSPTNFGAKGYCEVGDEDSNGFDQGSRLDCGTGPGQGQGHGVDEEEPNAHEKSVNPRIPAALLPMIGKPSDDGDD